MSMRYPGGLIATSPVNAAYPSGVWTQAQAIPYQSQNVWTRDQYWPYTTLLLQGDGAVNGAQNNTFLDSSTNNFSVTRNGNTTQGSFTPYEANGYWSNYFDGSGDYLSSPNNTAIHVLGSDFCLEGWFFLAGAQGDNGLYSTYTSVSGNDNGYLVRLTSTAIRFAAGTGSGAATAIDRTYAFTVGQWYHFAVTNSGSTGRIFINGVQQGATFSTSGFANSSSDLWIGRVHTTTNDFPGYLSNFRIVKGSAVYTSAFTPSTSPLTAITNTSLLTCQSNRFLDNSTNAFAITVNGSPSVQAFQPFPGQTTYSTSVLGGSGYFDGTGDYLNCGSNAALRPGTGDYTIEAWVYLPSFSTDMYLINQDFNNAGGSFGNFLFYADNSTGTCKFFSSTNGSSWNVVNALSMGTLRTNEWTHFAVARQSGTVRTFRNGDLVASTSDGSADLSNTGNVLIATYGANIDTNAYMSGIRLQKGTAQYTASFTCPTSPPTAITNTSLLLNFTNAGISDAAMMNDLETVGNAQVSTSVVKYGTGSMAFDGTGDRLVGVNTPNLNFGAGSWTVEFWIYATDQVIGPIVNQCSQASSAGWSIWAYNGASGANRKLTVFLNGASFSLVTGADAWASNTWTHIAVVKSGTNLTVYSNGVNVASSTSAPATLTNTTAPPMIGATVSGVNWGTSYDFTGYLDDLRVTNAVRYAGNFTPPPARMPGQ